MKLQPERGMSALTFLEGLQRKVPKRFACCHGLAFQYTPGYRYPVVFCINTGKDIIHLPSYIRVQL